MIPKWNTQRKKTQKNDIASNSQIYLYLQSLKEKEQNIFEEIVAENYPNLLKIIKP